MSIRIRGPLVILTATSLLLAVGHARGGSIGLHLGTPGNSTAEAQAAGGRDASTRVANAALVKRGFTVNPDGRVGAMVELADPSAVEVYLHGPAASALSAGAQVPAQAAAQAVAAAQAQIAHLDQVQQEMVAVLTGPAIAADLIYRVRRVYNGIAIQVDPAALETIRALPGVKAVHPLVPKHLENFTSVPFIGAPQVWGGVGGGATGAGVKVGVIDTGIDYLHHDFGGSGAVPERRELRQRRTGRGPPRSWAATTSRATTTTRPASTGRRRPRQTPIRWTATATGVTSPARWRDTGRTRTGARSRVRGTPAPRSPRSMIGPGVGAAGAAVRAEDLRLQRVRRTW